MGLDGHNSYSIAGLEIPLYMLLQGKKGVVFGLANKLSLAWHIGQALKGEGADVLFGVASERFQEKAAPLAESLGSPLPLICDVTDDSAIEKTFETLSESCEKLDFLVHAIAFAERADLEGRFVDTSRSGYALAQDVSAFSLVALSKAALPLLREGGSILTLSYLGSSRAVPSYKVMGVAKAALESAVRYLAVDLGPEGVRVNALSAGPIKTLSSSAIKGLKEKLDIQDRVSPLRRQVTGEDVGKAATFLLSDHASGVTGEILHVDCGSHALGSWEE